MTTTVDRAAHNVPERHYTHHAGRGDTPMRSNPAAIHRDLATLEVDSGMRVIEIGTGSGYSGGLLATLVGKTGRVTSLDIDPYLVQWARIIHHELGIDNVHAVTTDGVSGCPADAPYDRLVGWCTPPVLPAAWVEQINDGGIIVTPLPIAAVPHLTVVAKIRITAGRPQVEALYDGGYMETTASPVDSDVPTRYLDWEYRVPDAAWISIAWRAQDDERHTHARAALDRLRAGSYSEPYPGDTIDWSSWRTWVAATGDPHLTMAGLAPHYCALGHTTPGSAALVQQDGLIIADSPTSPSLTVLRRWLTEWETAARPATDSYLATLIHHPKQDIPGWELQLSARDATARTTTPHTTWRGC